MLPYPASLIYYALLSTVKRSDKDNEPTSELMEVVFKWQETRDTIEESIYLISSLVS